MWHTLRHHERREGSSIVEHEELGRVKLIFVEEFNKKDQPCTVRPVLTVQDSVQDTCQPVAMG